MAKRKAVSAASRKGDYEPLSKLLGLLSSRWTLLLLHRLHMEGPTRFGELRRRLGGVSTKTLTERLRLLESEGLLSRHYEPTVPPQVTYAITPRVLELESVMEELDRIAERWYGDGGSSPSPKLTAQGTIGEDQAEQHIRRPDRRSRR